MLKKVKSAGPLFSGPLPIATKYNRKYIGRPPARADLYGRFCRVLITWRGAGTVRNVMVEFENGDRVVCPIRTIRIRKE